MSKGTYQEGLPCGGTLKVNADSWLIQYYWPGPDRRHNGTLFDIRSSQIDEYINAWTGNFAEYLRLLESVPSGGQFSKTGLAHMTIRIGGFRPGVALRDYSLVIKNKSDLEKVVASLQYSKNRAAQVATLLRTIG